VLQSDLLISFPSWILDSAVFPSRVNLFLERDDSVRQPMSGHTNSCQAALFQEISLVGQGNNLREFKRSGFFTPSPLEFRKSINKGGEAGFMVLIVEPCPVTSPK
jgi:hypothetical protein